MLVEFYAILRYAYLLQCFTNKICYVSFKKVLSYVIVWEKLVKKCVLSRDSNFVMSLGFFMCSGRSFQYFATA